MVMTTEKECDKAYRDYSEGFFGAPWDHRLNDDEWREVSTSQTERRAESAEGGVLVVPVHGTVVQPSIWHPCTAGTEHDRARLERGSGRGRLCVPWPWLFRTEK